MAVFEKCPTYGEFAFVKSELGDTEYKVFLCNNNHQFKKKIGEKQESKDDKEVWKHMPEWARILKEVASKMEHNEH